MHENANESVRQSSLLTPTPALGMDEIHVLQARLDTDGLYLEMYEQVLSEDELERANRFYFWKDRRDFITARWFLRTVLACYLKTDASGLQFSYNAHGKPALAGKLSSQELCFNLSHSGGLVLLAVARGRHVGIDVELVSSHPADKGIIEQSCSPSEASILYSLPRHMQSEAFFRCWTRKEAYLKARGQGLASCPKQFSVPMDSAGPTSHVATIRARNGVPPWSIWHLALAPGYIGALASEGSACGVNLCSLSSTSFCGISASPAPTNTIIKK